MSERRSFPAPPSRPGALLLTAHPSPEGFNSALAMAWRDGAEAAGLHVEQIHVADLAFDPCRRGGYGIEEVLEPDLIHVRDAIARAAHVVVASPLWWSSIPASLKGLFDRVLLPGWAFRYENHRPVAGLTGRSGRLIMTMDAPVWYDTLVYRGAARRQVAQGTLRFCGLSPVRVNAFGSIGTSTDAARQRMLDRCRTEGARDARQVLARFSDAVPALAG